MWPHVVPVDICNALSRHIDSRFPLNVDVFRQAYGDTLSVRAGPYPVASWTLRSLAQVDGSVGLCENIHQACDANGSVGNQAVSP